MGDAIIQVERLGKRYRLRHDRAERYVALRDVIASKVRGMLSRGRGAGTPVRSCRTDIPSVEDFWALRDVSFEVGRGEVVGIIGRNGAGKSTLLKILSRITEPTEGRIELDGRVASLLEVGTGFHPELTGRENIFLNGAILGMTRLEIRRKFDEIVAFAEVERFLDTPVKRYSSGMYVRLAFSVAAHLEPEILVVDEVLAVGDAEFQKKCLGKMRDVSLGGRTVLFVSHNLAAIQALCGSAVLLERGQLVRRSGVGAAVARYLEASSDSTASFTGRALSDALFLATLETAPGVIRGNDRIAFELQIEASGDEVIADLMIEIYSVAGQLVAIVDLRSGAGPYRLRAGGTLVIRTEVVRVPFVEGEFSLALYVNANSVCQSFGHLCGFTVLPAESANSAAVVVPRDPRFRGVVDLDTSTEARVQSK